MSLTSKTNLGHVKRIDTNWFQISKVGERGSSVIAQPHSHVMQPPSAIAQPPLHVMQLPVRVSIPVVVTKEVIPSGLLALGDL